MPLVVARWRSRMKMALGEPVRESDGRHCRAEPGLDVFRVRKERVEGVWVGPHSVLARFA